MKVKILSSSIKISGFTFIHNGDYSGDIRIIRNATTEQIEIPSDTLFEFVADYIRHKRISELEDMSAEDLLK